MNFITFGLKIILGMIKWLVKKCNFCIGLSKALFFYLQYASFMGNVGAICPKVSFTFSNAIAWRYKSGLLWYNNASSLIRFTIKRGNNASFLYKNEVILDEEWSILVQEYSNFGAGKRNNIINNKFVRAIN